MCTASVKKRRACNKHVCTESVVVIGACYFRVLFVKHVNPDARMVEFDAPAGFVEVEDLLTF